MKIPSRIGQFKRIISKDSTMEYGYYYSLDVTLPFAKQTKRDVRVWLPEDYDFENPSNRYPVIYMSDGQNLVNERLTAYGEWKFDKTVHKLLTEGTRSVIAVGIDCPIDPVERMQELCPPYVPKKEIAFKKDEELTNTYADKFIDYIISNIKPLVDKIFYTLKDREHTAIGGSSMGGLMSGYAYIYRPDVFGFALVFSPAFFFYKISDCKKVAKSLGINPKNNGQIFLYTGGKGFEAQFLEDTVGIYNFLKELGFENHQAKLIVDSDAEHNESAWAKVLPLALKFWLKNKKID